MVGATGWWAVVAADEGRRHGYSRRPTLEAQLLRSTPQWRSPWPWRWTRMRSPMQWSSARAEVRSCTPKGSSTPEQPHLALRAASSCQCGTPVRSGQGSPVVVGLPATLGNVGPKDAGPPELLTQAVDGDSLRMRASRVGCDVCWRLPKRARHGTISHGTVHTAEHEITLAGELLNPWSEQESRSNKAGKHTSTPGSARTNHKIYGTELHPLGQSRADACHP